MYGSQSVLRTVSLHVGIVVCFYLRIFLVLIITTRTSYFHHSKKKKSIIYHLFVFFSSSLLQQKKKYTTNDEVFSSLCILIFDLSFIITWFTGEWLSNPCKKNDNKNEEGRRMDKKNVENTTTNNRRLNTISIDDNTRVIFDEIRWYRLQVIFNIL